MSGKYKRVPPLVRLLRKSVKDGVTGCWIWKGYTDKNGYGHIGDGEGKVERVHRLAWKILRGPIPEGHDVHHKCDNKACWRPEHVKAVARRKHRHIHARPVVDGKEHCHRGHAMTEANTYVDPRGRRHCRACKALAAKRFKERHRERVNRYRRRWYRANAEKERRRHRLLRARKKAAALKKAA